MKDILLKDLTKFVKFANVALDKMAKKLFSKYNSCKLVKPANRVEGRVVKRLLFKLKYSNLINPENKLAFK